MNDYVLPIATTPFSETLPPLHQGRLCLKTFMANFLLSAMFCSTRPLQDL